MSLTVDPTTNHMTTSGFQYDLNGNATNLPNLTSTLTYDIENRTGSNNTTYPRLFYDLENQPLDRTGGGQWNLYGLHGERLATYTYSPGNQLDRPNPCTGYCYYLRHGYPTQTSRNIYFGGRLIQSNNKTVVLDRLGSVRANEAGETFEYFPYGEEISTTANDREKFATYTRESATGLDYADQRYYSSVYGTFTSSDPLHTNATSPADPMNPGSWNRYSYAGGDPVNRYDPSGNLYCTGYLDGDLACTEGAPVGGPTYNGCAADGFVQTPGPNDCYVWGAGGFWVLDNQHVTPPTCSLEVFRRPAKFKGDPGQHTYLDLCVDGTTNCQIVEGGRDNKKTDATYGDMLGFRSGFRSPPGQVLGFGSLHASNPLQDSQVKSTQPIPCDDIEDVDYIVDNYNASPVKYAFLPNGASTYNSNSFTSTLLNDLGLWGAFGQLPTSLLGGIPFFPGWGQTVPGLHMPQP
jgi:RHS repeat-associated protein